MDMPIAKLPRWQYAHPLALLHYLSVIGPKFGELMYRCIVPGVPLRIILYIDEICPGNPLRPEKSRTLQAIYWAFLDWPQLLLQRTAAWPAFGAIRSTLVSEYLPGGVAALMKSILLLFFKR